MPLVVAGTSSLQNKCCIEWGWTGFVAFGSQSLVVVAHPTQVQWIQTLQGHASNVVKVRWSRENYPHERIASSVVSRKDSTATRAGRLRLASVDAGGQIIVWDVLSGAQISTFNESISGGKVTTCEMYWLPWQDASNDLLLVLHAPNVLVLWNAEQATKIWRKSYIDSTLSTFTLDPFQFSNAAFLTLSGNVMLIDDFSFSKPPPSNGQHFRVSPTATATVTAVDDIDAKRASLATVFIKRPLIKVLTTAADRILDTGAESVPVSISDETWTQIAYHPAVRNILFLVNPREIVVLDAQNVQTVTQIVFEKSASPLLQIIPCSLRDAVFFVQENGAISFRLLKYKSTASPRLSSEEHASDALTPLDIVYELICTSEVLRITKSNRVIGATMCPSGQRRLALLLSGGKLMTYELTTPDGTMSTSSLSDLVRVKREDLSQEIVTKLRFSNFGAMSNLTGCPTVVRACPVPDGPGKQMAAVGTGEGFIQLVNIHSGDVDRDLAVHSCPVKCLEWVGADHLISAAHSQTLSTSSVVRNELYFTDVRTGMSKLVRPECDESPIELLRVSHFCCFLAIAFRDQPMEIWDLKAFRLLRRMAKTCPIIVDVAWSTKHNQQVEAHSAGEDVPTQPPPQPQSARPVFRENLVVLDDDSHLYHVVVKGIHVRDGKEVNTQRATNAVVTAMAWKDEMLVFGYADGRVSAWNLEAKQFKSSLAQRGSVRRVQFSKQPGDSNFLVLHADGAAVWNATKFQCLHQYNQTAPNMKVVDADLAGDENLPILITSDGCLRVFDPTMTRQTRSVDDNGWPKCFSSSFISQHLLTTLKVILLDKNVLDCYSKLEDYELITSTPYTSDELLSAIHKLDVDESDKNGLLRHLAVLDDDALSALGSAPTVAHRALTLSRMLGDEWGVNFWTLAISAVCTPSADLQTPTNFDLLLDKAEFRKLQIRRCSTFDAKRCTSEQLRNHVEHLVLLGKFEWAAQALLDTDAGRADYYADCLKACLLSSAHTSTACQSTIKLAATNLIADGRLNEGVELLRVIDRNLDACRYLQSFSRWEKAAWLAKAALDDEECRDVLRRWVEALCGPQLSKKTFAVLLLMSMRQWDKALEMLLSMKQIQTAALFADFITTCVAENESNVQKNLLENIYSEYARLLFAVELKKVAFAYCAKAGDRGIAVTKEFEFLNSE